MARKRYKAEEIVAKLRCSDVAGTEHGGCDPPDRRERGDLVYDHRRLAQERKCGTWHLSPPGCTAAGPAGHAVTGTGFCRKRRPGRNQALVAG